MPIITISRQTGSLGHRIAREVSIRLSYPYFDKRTMAKAIAQLTTSLSEIDSFLDNQASLTRLMDQIISQGEKLGSGPTSLTDREQKIIAYLDEQRTLPLVRRCVQELKNKQNAVIVGRGSQVILKDHPEVLHIRIFTPETLRAERIAQWRKLSEADARGLIQEQDKLSSQYIKRFYGVDWDDPALYYLIINTSKWDVEGATQIVIQASRVLVG